VNREEGTRTFAMTLHSRYGALENIVGAIFSINSAERVSREKPKYKQSLPSRHPALPSKHVSWSSLFSVRPDRPTLWNSMTDNLCDQFISLECFNASSTTVILVFAVGLRAHLAH